ncbi:response regulator transcription factor [Natronospora cellulosivora (SeqCode)]
MKVLIVDDDSLIRDGLKMILDMEEDIEIIGTAVNGEEAYQLCSKERPEIVLMDIRMPVMDGVQATKMIKKDFKDIKIIILTTFKDSEYIRSAVKAGAEGYILKSRPSESIIESIRAVAQGDVVFEKEVASLLSDMVEKKQQKKSYQDYQLTDREYEITKLLSMGMSNSEIGEELYISEGTVRNYISNILGKLELRDRTQLAIFFLRNLE